MVELRGRFVIWPNDPEKRQVIPNQLLDEGEEAFLKMIVHADDSEVASNGQFWVGLCSGSYEESDTMSDIDGEPTSAGGYERQSIRRANSSLGWPTVSQVNEAWRARSAQVNFAASGADYSTTITRMFIATASAGDGGKFFAVSQALATALQISDGDNIPMAYELYIK